MHLAPSVSSQLTTAPVQLRFFVSLLVGLSPYLFYFENFSTHFISSIALHKKWHGLSGDLAQPSVLIVLSARSEERLCEQVRQLLTWVEVEMCEGEPALRVQRLQDLAYTLQVGRSSMEERLALQVGRFPAQRIVEAPADACPIACNPFSG